MIGTLKRAVTRELDRGFYECRRCGTCLDPPAATCAACGSREIARYEL
jgi:uncharacterized OB-fold protein